MPLVGKAEEPASGLYLIVTPRVLADGAGKLADYRRDDGYEVVIGVLEEIAGSAGRSPRAEQVKAWIDKVSASKSGQQGQTRRPAAIVLCGDETESVDENPPWRVPTYRKPLYRWRSKQRNTFTSDSVYGDMDGDDLPDVPVGRVPARSAEDVLRYVAKLRNYESRDAGPEDLRTVLWLGIPGYDAQADAMMTPIGMQAVRQYLPPTLTCWWLSADPRWPCWLPPDEQPRRFLAEMAGGSLFNFYGGHGSETTCLANVAKPTRTVMKIDDLAHVTSKRPAAPLAILACTTGRFEWDKGPCLAEAMLRHEGGPVVVAAASTESHPLTNYYTAIGLGRTVQRGYRTFGAWWIDAQRIGFQERAPYIEAVMKDAEGKLEPQINVPLLRRDQPLMFNILGDPACRMRFPQPLSFDASCEGSRVTVKADIPTGAKQACLDVMRPQQQYSAGKTTTSAETADAVARARRLEQFNDRFVRLGLMETAPGARLFVKDLPPEVTGNGGQVVLRLAAFGSRGQVWAGVANVTLGQEQAGR
jgi:hypothetical protein